MKTWALLCTCVFVLGLAFAAKANDEGDAYDMMPLYDQEQGRTKTPVPKKMALSAH